MTVRRQAQSLIDASPDIVAAAVRSVLSQRPPYRGTLEISKNSRFKTNVKPGWWLSGTDMTVELSPFGAGTVLEAATQSQFYILGDVFDFYNGYIQGFFSEVRRALGGGRPQMMDLSEKASHDAPTAA